MRESLRYETVVKTKILDVPELFHQIRKAFDVVVTDMTMPNMKGLNLARELVRIRSDIPINLCTGFSEAIHQDAIQRAGIREVLMKPLPIPDLEEALRRAMGRGNPC
jgi:CheY-like chemotaxis protein